MLPYCCAKVYDSKNSATALTYFDATNTDETAKDVTFDTNSIYIKFVAGATKTPVLECSWDTV